MSSEVSFSDYLKCHQVTYSEQRRIDLTFSINKEFFLPIVHIKIWVETPENKVSDQRHEIGLLTVNIATSQITQDSLCHSVTGRIVTWQKLPQENLDIFSYIIERLLPYIRANISILPRWSHRSCSLICRVTKI